MKNKVIFMLLVFLAAGTVLSGQVDGRRMTIAGYVVDVNNQPVFDAVILVNGEETHVVTDHEGYYRIKIRSSEQPVNVSVLVTANGEPLRLNKPAEGNKRIDFTLPVSVTALQSYEEYRLAREKIVDIGYGSIKKRDLTGPVSSLDNRNSRYDVYTSIYDMLSEVPGVVVRGSDIQIQGPTSRSLSTQPLFIVDGNYVNSISHISPLTVKSVEVLKGPSAAIYGVRGANGVIIINTLTNPD